jgi:hypothetical protein
MNRYLNILGAIVGYTFEVAGIVMLGSAISRRDSGIEDLFAGAGMYVFGRALNNGRLSTESDGQILESSEEKPRSA